MKTMTKNINKSEKVHRVAKKAFSAVYNDLNETQKGLLRTAFLEEHGYSLDAFYKKLRGKFRPNEQKWLCAHLDLKQSNVSFPK